MHPSLARENKEEKSIGAYCKEKEKKGDFVTGDLLHWGTAAKTNGAS